VVLIWPLETWRNGVHCESKSTIGMKLDVNNTVFGKTLNAICLRWKSSYL
jgi:hypothetical protein